MRLLTLLLLLLPSIVLAQSAASYTVQMQVKIENGTDIKLTWNADGNAIGHNVYRKATDDSSWGVPIATLSGSDTTYTDQNLDEDTEYEYLVIKSTGTYTGYGYTHSGIKLELPADRGDVLLIVEESIANGLDAEVQQLQEDMEADGWRVQVHDVSADSTVSYVKSIITDAHQTLGALKMVYLLGHVPVPYSGNLVPDGHSNHVGAWPADVYYAEVNNTWSDNSVNNTTASDSRNHNIPGDGKLDQSVLPGNAELMVGRVDFANMTVFAQDELELTRRYLERAHDFKHAGWTLPERALIDDHFGGFGGEAFASNGWRNFSPLVGRQNMIAADYRTTLATDGYLFSYGCGGGSHTSANGIGNSTQLASDSLLTAFTQLFGSYFGDWDRQDNFLRSALAQGRTLSISWSGRPHWHYQSMGMGYPIGYSALLSQNNTTLYTANYGARFVHVALLGDPSLRMAYLAPPTQLTVDSIETLHVELNWTASTESGILGYNIYESVDDSPWFKVNDEIVLGTNYIDSCVIHAGDYQYAVKAVKLVENYSGSYFNESLGAVGEISILSTKFLEGQYEISHGGNWLHLVSLDKWADAQWVFDGTTVTGSDTKVEWDDLTSESTIDFQLVLENDCQYLSLPITYDFSVLGPQEVALLPGMQLYPNPARAGSEVYLSLGHKPELIEIRTIDGRMVDQTWQPGQKRRLPNLAPGTYLLRVVTEGDQQTIPLVVH